MKKVGGNMKKMNERTVKENMTHNTEYIDWLINFTKENPIFSDNDWNYYKEDLRKEDYARVKALPLFFECIDTFANRNYLASRKNEWGESYCIQKDDTYLVIGYNSGENTSFYCERTNQQEGSINYYSIVNENIPMRTEYIDNRLQEISEELKDLMIKLNVPVSYIKEMLSNTNKEVEKEKRLIKSK